MNELYQNSAYGNSTVTSYLEQKTLSAKVEELMGEWERIETEMAELG